MLATPAYAAVDARSPLAPHAIQRREPGANDVLIDIHARDERDSHRSAAPLLRAPDALMLDTTQMNAADALAEAIRLVSHMLQDQDQR